MSTTGYIQSVAGELFYERRGAASGTPLVAVHGGPGFTSYYLEPLFDVQSDRPVVLYDQAGCGRARRSGGRKSFSVAGFVDELEQLREALGLESVHLLGHSFGGVIVGEYALRFPHRVATAVFACVSIDIPRWVADSERLISKLPLMQRMVLAEGKRSGNLDSPEYQRALSQYYDKHIYGIAPLPSCLSRAIEESDTVTYSTVWGRNELVVSGVVQEYSLTPRLSEISCPTLFVCGRHDEATPEAHEYFASLVPEARCVVFEQSAHHPQLSETEQFVRVVRDFVSG